MAQLLHIQISERNCTQWRPVWTNRSPKKEIKDAQTTAQQVEEIQISGQRETNPIQHFVLSSLFRVHARAFLLRIGHRHIPDWVARAWLRARQTSEQIAGDQLEICGVDQLEIWAVLAVNSSDMMLFLTEFHRKMYILLQFMRDSNERD